MPVTGERKTTDDGLPAVWAGGEWRALAAIPPKPEMLVGMKTAAQVFDQMGYVTFHKQLDFTIAINKALFNIDTEILSSFLCCEYFECILTCSTKLNNTFL